MRLPALILALAALCACSSPHPAAPAAAMQEAFARQDGFTVRATTLPTSALSEAMAREYGLARSESTVMLLVMVRRDANGQEAAAPASVQARVTDLRGQSRALALRSVRTPSGADVLEDHLGTLEISPPETLSFDVQAAPQGGAPITLRFNRDFVPR